MEHTEGQREWEMMALTVSCVNLVFWLEMTVRGVRKRINFLPSHNQSHDHRINSYLDLQQAETKLVGIHRGGKLFAGFSCC